ncbi:hypothetical protein NQ318_022677 [Aromia moschata]|uniref:Uncharacterized protein n=1 Tax=Aromia moschata TaxID=1265417 RepID=A0AAV8YM13_9CUCU|nr:hypothetical protein NQ318_022677 [Aromia moschata]
MIQISHSIKFHPFANYLPLLQIFEKRRQIQSRIYYQRNKKKTMKNYMDSLWTGETQIMFVFRECLNCLFSRTC